MYHINIMRRTSFLLIIPLALSAFTHLWDTSGSPIPDVDEGIYLGRAINFLDTFNPSDPFDSYDHHYFGRIFLGILLYLVGYQNLLGPHYSMCLYGSTLSGRYCKY